MIIEKLTHTGSKTVLVFRDDEFDPFVKTAEVKRLPELLQSHIDAVADHIVKDQKEKYDEDKKQTTLGFGEGDSEGEDEDEIPLADPEGESEELPTHPSRS